MIARHTRPGQARGASPYLSVVVTARNDNHGGNLLGRVQLFVESLLEQCQRHELRAELVLVEWNPPTDRPPLFEAIDWPRGGLTGPGCAVRVITVSQEIHARFDHHEALPLFQMIAKNVGIRRAQAPFILATNIDVLLAEPLIAFIAGQKLRRDRMYRCDRHDVEPHPPRDLSPQDRLDWCAARVMRVNERVGSTHTRSGDFNRIYFDPSPGVTLLEGLQNLKMVPVVTRKRLHCNGCGDFTLMHRDGWEAVHGYAQFAMYSMHIDSLLCTAAHFAGWRERALTPPMVAYHLEHASGSGWSPEGQAALNERLSRAGVPQVSIEQYHRWSIQMRREGCPILFNDDRWGLIEETFDEVNPLEHVTRAGDQAVCAEQQLAA